MSEFRKSRLELTWIGKEARPKLEPRILLEDPAQSSHASKRISEDDVFDNRLIFGDNLLALRALEPEFAGSVRCVYIDPPYNTGQAFEHYDDGLEHSTWLSMMRERLEILHRLLHREGCLFVHLDQEELHYAKVVLDEIFLRQNFLGQIAYERSGVSGLGQGGSFLVNTHECILAYAKEKTSFQLKDDRGAAPLELKDMKRYSSVFNSPGEREEVARFFAPATGEPVVIFRHRNFDIGSISLRKYAEREPEIRASYSRLLPKIFRTTSVQAENEFQTRILAECGEGLYSADYLVSRGKRAGQRITSYYLNRGVFAWLADTAEERDGEIVKVNRLSDFWTHAELPKADLANEGGVEFRRGKKPETLLRRILSLSTTRGDLVLDSFAGSGTTGAVAHKMGRRWIMVELGEHCHTHIIPRLKKVIDGEDPGGVTEAVGWKGGGGFRYYRLAPSLLEKDSLGNWVISKEFNAAMLAEAICKLEGFTYAPSETVYWQHGQSTERDFIYVTTQTLTREQLAHAQRGSRRRAVAAGLCSAFRVRDVDAFPNLTVKKIPKAVLSPLRMGQGRLQPRDQEPAAPPSLSRSCTPLPRQRRRKPKWHNSRAAIRRRTIMNRHVNAIAIA